MNNKQPTSELSDLDLAEFIVLWIKEFGETISMDQARERATELVDLFWLLAKHKREKEAATNSQEHKNVRTHLEGRCGRCKP